jgi:hypothetical protein
MVGTEKHDSTSNTMVVRIDSEKTVAMMKLLTTAKTRKVENGERNPGRMV